MLVESVLPPSVVVALLLLLLLLAPRGAGVYLCLETLPVLTLVVALLGMGTQYAGGVGETFCRMVTSGKGLRLILVSEEGDEGLMGLLLGIGMVCGGGRGRVRQFSKLQFIKAAWIRIDPTIQTSTPR
jgi:hypothetical protein